MGKNVNLLLLLSVLSVASCSSDDEDFLENTQPATASAKSSAAASKGESAGDSRGDEPLDSSEGVTKYIDSNGDVAYIPAEFQVSGKADERTIRTGLVVIGPDGSEYVWVSTHETPLQQRNFGSFFSGGSISSYHDDTTLPAYQAMSESVGFYEGFYVGRYEASQACGSSLADYVPASKPVTSSQSGRIWIQFSPQDATIACENLYRTNPTVQGFFLWGCNWDTTLQWLVDTGNKTYEEVASNSTSWGNYSNDDFSPGARGNYTGAYEQAKANNIYDLAGNNWEWTQERYGSNYVMRSGGYNLMGGSCPGDYYPASIRDPLPGNNHHPNVCFRVGLFVTVGVEIVGESNDDTTGIKPIPAE